MKKINKDKMIDISKKALKFIFNPHFLLSFGLAWMITNGWAYIVLILGLIFSNFAMTYLAGGYLTFIWLFVVSEKIITIPLAIIILKLLFPKDIYTLAVLNKLYEAAKEKIKNKNRSKEDKK